MHPQLKRLISDENLILRLDKKQPLAIFEKGSLIKRAISNAELDLMELSRTSDFEASYILLDAFYGKNLWVYLPSEKKVEYNEAGIITQMSCRPYFDCALFKRGIFYHIHPDAIFNSYKKSSAAGQIAQIDEEYRGGVIKCEKVLQAFIPFPSAADIYVALRAAFTMGQESKIASSSGIMRLKPVNDFEEITGFGIKYLLNKPASQENGWPEFEEVKKLRETDFGHFFDFATRKLLEKNIDENSNLEEEIAKTTGELNGLFSEIMQISFKPASALMI